jgi:acetyltransferase-like isoleucine patch superfamily enzyme
MNPFATVYYNEHDLSDAGFKAIGENIQIASNCTIIGLENIEIGNNVRIDSYCSIIATGGGWLTLGSYIHIGGYCHLSAGDGIRMDDHSGLSQGVRVYSTTDDYSGKYLTNPTVPAKYTGIIGGTVVLERHVIVGAGSVIFPNVTVGEGSSIGAQSLINRSLDSWGVFCGSPARRLKNRARQLLDLEEKLKEENAL